MPTAGPLRWKDAQRLVDHEWLDPPLAGVFHDRSLQVTARLRVIGAARRPRSGERYLLVQNGGSGAGWWRADDIELLPDEPSP